MPKRIEVGTETFVRFWLVIICFVLLMLFIQAAATGLLIIGLALFLAIAINPLVQKIDPRGRQRGLASVAAVVLVVGVIGGIVAMVGPMVVQETTHYFSESPESSAQLERGTRMLNNIGNSFGVENLSGRVWQGIKDFINQMIQGLGSTLVAGVGTVVNFLTGAVLTIVLTILFLIEGPGVLQKFWKAVAARNKQAAVVWRRVSLKMSDVIAKYVTGQLSVAILDGIVVASTVAILSLIFKFSMGLAIPMGMVTMTCYMIPMVGPIIGCGIVGALLFFSSPGAALSFVIFYAIYQQIESNIIAPHVQGSRMNLPLVFILIAITLGMYVFGLLGAIISIPVAGCIKVLITEYPNIKALRKE